MNARETAARALADAAAKRKLDAFRRGADAIAAADAEIAVGDKRPEFIPSRCRPLVRKVERVLELLREPGAYVYIAREIGHGPAARTHMLYAGDDRAYRVPRDVLDKVRKHCRTEPVINERGGRKHTDGYRWTLRGRIDIPRDRV